MSRQSVRTYLEEEVVNPAGDSERAEVRMAQVERTFTRKEYLYMMKQLLSRENLLTALKRVEKNKGSHGVDGMSE